MPTLHRTLSLPYPPEQVYAWHARPGAFQRLLPPWQRVVLQRATGDFANLRAEMQMYLGPMPLTWIAQHSGNQPGRQFIDTQERGPFAAWQHTHGFEPAGAGCTLVDHIDYTLPLAPLSHWLVGGRIHAMLEKMFDFRHQRTQQDFLRHARYADAPRLRIAVSGASGLVGAQLCAYLATAGHTVLRLVRRASRDPLEIAWDPERGTVDTAKLAGTHAVVHLAGENVGEGRWNAARKPRLLQSRVSGTRTLAHAMAQLIPRPQVLISASATGYYGDQGDSELNEQSPAGDLYMSEICAQWEAAAEPARQAGIRVVHPRIGAVVSAHGGILAKLLWPFKLCAGGPVGSGRQFLPWIALEDILGAVELCLHRAEVSGPVNLVAPQQLRQAAFAQTLARVLHRPAFVPLPAAAVRVLFGQMGEEVLLAGQRAVPKRLEELGFSWLYPQLDAAIGAELGMAADRPA